MNELKLCDETFWACFLDWWKENFEWFSSQKESIVYFKFLIRKLEKKREIGKERMISKFMSMIFEWIENNLWKFQFILRSKILKFNNNFMLVFHFFWNEFILLNWNFDSMLFDWMWNTSESFNSIEWNFRKNFLHSFFFQIQSFFNGKRYWIESLWSCFLFNLRMVLKDSVYFNKNFKFTSKKIWNCIFSFFSIWKEILNWNFESVLFGSVWNTSESSKSFPNSIPTLFNFFNFQNFNFFQLTIAISKCCKNKSFLKWIRLNDLSIKFYNFFFFFFCEVKPFFSNSLANDFFDLKLSEMCFHEV